MSCCGNWRNGPNPIRSDTKHGPVPPLLFEFQGQGQLILYGRVTGMRYHFTGPGARVRVDVRDAPVLQVIGGLSLITNL